MPRDTRRFRVGVEVDSSFEGTDWLDSDFELAFISSTDLDALTTGAFMAGMRSAELIVTIDVEDHNPAVLAKALASINVLGNTTVGAYLRAEEPGAVLATMRVLHTMWESASPSQYPQGPIPHQWLPLYVDTYELDALELAGGVITTDPRQSWQEINEWLTRLDRTREELRWVYRAKDKQVNPEALIDQGFDTLIVSRTPQINQIKNLITDSPPQGLVAPPVWQRSKRRLGIDYDSLPSSIKPIVVEPGSPRFGQVRSTYLRSGAPGLVLQPETINQTRDALLWALDQPVRFSRRSGGHGFSGRSTNDGGIVLDLSLLNRIKVLAKNRVRVQPGARWADVAQVLTPHGLAITSGDSGGVGVGGLATAGGIGLLSRAQGLTIDRLRRLTMITAAGEIIEVNDEENPELFFGMRGAGFNFGVVVDFEFRPNPTTDVGYAVFVYDITADPAGFIHRWGQTVEAWPWDSTSFLTIGAPQQGQVIAQTMNVVDSPSQHVVVDRLESLTQLAPVLQHQAVLAPYGAIVATGPRMPHRGGAKPTSRSGLLRTITHDFATQAEQLLLERRSGFFQIRALGGATTQVGTHETAFAHRTSQFSVMAMGPPSRLDPGWERLKEHFLGLYLNFETGRGQDVLRAAFPPETLTRLQALKAVYDPENVFNDNFPIPPGTA